MSEQQKNAPELELNEILQVRRDKLAALQAEGRDPFLLGELPGGGSVGGHP